MKFSILTITLEKIQYGHFPLYKQIRNCRIIATLIYGAKRISNYIDQPMKAVVSVEYSGNILKCSFTFGNYDCLKTQKGSVDVVAVFIRRFLAPRKSSNSGKIGALHHHVRRCNPSDQ